MNVAKAAVFYDWHRYLHKSMLHHLGRGRTGVGLYFIALVWECRRCRSAGCTIYNIRIGTNPIDVNPATVGAYCIRPISKAHGYRTYFIRAYAIRPYRPSPQCYRFCVGTVNKTYVDTYATKPRSADWAAIEPPFLWILSKGCAKESISPSGAITRLNKSSR